MKFIQASFVWLALFCFRASGFQQSHKQNQQRGGLYSTVYKHRVLQTLHEGHDVQSKTQLNVGAVTPSDLSGAPPSDDRNELGNGDDAPPAAAAQLPTDPVSKFRKLKDIMWTREAVEDVTAAEFACSVEASARFQDESLRRHRKRAVDYEKMLTNLNRRISDMKCEPFELIDDTDTELDETQGMGRFSCTPEERKELLV